MLSFSGKYMDSLQFPKDQNIRKLVLLIKLKSK